MSTQRTIQWAVTLMVAALALSLLPGASAHLDREAHGTLTLHTSPTSEPIGSLETVECEFWVRGSNLSHDEGTLQAFRGGPAGNFYTILGDFEATQDGEGNFEFLAGPFSLARSQDYNLIAHLEGLSGEHTTYTSFHYRVCEDETLDEFPPCVANVQAEATPEGVLVTWNATEEADGYIVSRHPTGEPVEDEQIGWTRTTTFLDETAERGVSYTYEVESFNRYGQAQDCFHSAADATMPTEEDDEPPAPTPTTPPICTESELRAEAREDSTVFLDWDAANEESNQVEFYRVVRDGETIAEVQQTEFLDDTTEPGQTYSYEVQAHGDAGEGETVFTSCGSAEVTAIPFFGAPVLGALAMIGAVGAYAWIGRRKA